MDIALQLLSNILIPGAIFALLAASFGVIYSVSRVLHIAHGGVAIASGYLFYAGYAWFGWPIWLDILFALAGAIVLGIFINDQIYERMRNYGVVSTAGTLIATISVLLIIENLLLAIFGSTTKFFPALQGSVHVIGPVSLTDHEIRILMVAPITLILFVIFLAKTKTGKAMRAVADHEMISEVVGISAKHIRQLTFAMGSLLAGIAGTLFAIEYSLVPSMTIMLTLRMFFRAILGGVGSILGAILGSLLTETAFALTGWFWDIGWIDFVSFILIFLILLVRPQGIFGKRKRQI